MSHFGVPFPHGSTSVVVLFWVPYTRCVILVVTPTQYLSHVFLYGKKYCWWRAADYAVVRIYSISPARRDIFRAKDFVFSHWSSGTYRYRYRYLPQLPSELWGLSYHPLRIVRPDRDHTEKSFGTGNRALARRLLLHTKVLLHYFRHDLPTRFPKRSAAGPVATAVIATSCASRRNSIGAGQPNGWWVVLDHQHLAGGLIWLLVQQQQQPQRQCLSVAHASGWEYESSGTAHGVHCR